LRRLRGKNEERTFREDAVAARDVTGGEHSHAHCGCGFDDEVEPEKMLKKGRPVLVKEQQLEEEGKDIIICLLLSLSLSVQLLQRCNGILMAVHNVLLGW
jgi:hypothetical protein